MVLIIDMDLKVLGMHWIDEKLMNYVIWPILEDICLFGLIYFVFWNLLVSIPTKVAWFSI